MNLFLWTTLSLPFGLFEIFAGVLLWLRGVERADAVAIFIFSLGAAILFVVWYLRRRIKGQVWDGSAKTPCEVLTLGLSKDLDKTFEVRSQSQPWLTYEVNLYRMTCTCPGFKMGKKRLKRNSLHRMCKHLRATALAEMGADLGVLGPILSDWHQAECYIKHDDNVIFSYAPGRNWIYVYAKSDQIRDGRPAYERFRYNLGEGRWSQDRSPIEENLIKGMIRDYF